mmetsp:Transcript_20708/g.58079  ORF Transcript_20708/g.58079 Transcript_20708/m.58079 type:complete len:437 (+) Transcript_20708:962-2272(+)
MRVRCRFLGGCGDGRRFDGAVGAVPHIARRRDARVYRLVAVRHRPRGPAAAGPEVDHFHEHRPPGAAERLRLRLDFRDLLAGGAPLPRPGGGRAPVPAAAADPRQEPIHHQPRRDPDQAHTRRPLDMHAGEGVLLVHVFPDLLPVHQVHAGVPVVARHGAEEEALRPVRAGLLRGGHHHVPAAPRPRGAGVHGGGDDHRGAGEGGALALVLDGHLLRVRAGAHPQAQRCGDTAEGHRGGLREVPVRPEAGRHPHGADPRDTEDTGEGRAVDGEGGDPRRRARLAHLGPHRHPPSPLAADAARDAAVLLPDRAVRDRRGEPVRGLPEVLQPDDHPGRGRVAGGGDAHGAPLHREGDPGQPHRALQTPPRAREPLAKDQGGGEQEAAVQGEHEVVEDDHPPESVPALRPRGGDHDLLALPVFWVDALPEVRHLREYFI